MRLISFHFTPEQFRDGSKTVTRRLNWLRTKAGDLLRAVEKSQGRKKGEPLVDLGTIEVVSVRRERLDAITEDDVRLEGFKTATPAQFVFMFCAHMGCQASTIITRIEFKRWVPDPMTTLVVNAAGESALNLASEKVFPDRKKRGTTYMRIRR